MFSQAQNREILLNKNWLFSQKGKNTWNKAQVPGCVHSDLLANKMIPDPFYSTNETQLQWIENENWEYKSSFKLSAKDLKSERIEMIFEGLDTYANVYLNQELILSANNMFRSYSIDVKKYLKSGNNTLLVIFESAVKKGKDEAIKLPYTLPGDEKVFTRKAQYQYGWDWGPRFVTCGIYKNIKLKFINEAEIENLRYDINKLNDSIGVFTLKFDIHSDKDVIYDVVIKDATTNELVTPVEKLNSQFKKGITPFAVTATIPNPKLWWCNGMGKPHMYHYTVSLVKKSGIIATKSIDVGLRTIELVQQKDSVGKSFYFKLNGVPVFMKGANYIPSHSFLSELNDNNYRNDVALAKEANMNMLRVWGGGVYADDAFYAACNKNGILVWQDFMFACAMYPGDSSFVKNVREEAVGQVKRLRNHPCMAVWCGNNEIDEGWKNWGWQKQCNYSKQDSAKIWNDYLNLFHALLPSVVREHSAGTDYITSSPLIGWGHKESLTNADSHYWGVWWGNEPFEVYEKKVGRFMSEYGFQSMPALSTMKTICDSVNLHLSSDAIKAHQKHPTGFQTIEKYMARDFVIPKSLEHYSYVSQLLQAHGMKTAIEAHRRAKPYCMGTLFWQLNDCWPVTSWSSFDFYKQPKAFYYDLMRLYDNVLISVIKSDLYYECHVLNDHPFGLKGVFEISIKDFFGKVLYQKKSEVSIQPNSSLVYLRLTEDELKSYDKSACYMSCQLLCDSVKTKKTLFYFVPQKDLKLPKPELDIKYSDEFGSVKIKSKNLVKNLYIKDISYTENNYFDLEANEECEFTVLPFGKTHQKLTFISLYDILSQ